ESSWRLKLRTSTAREKDHLLLCSPILPRAGRRMPAVGHLELQWPGIPRVVPRGSGPASTVPTKCGPVLRAKATLERLSDSRSRLSSKAAQFAPAEVSLLT